MKIELTYIGRRINGGHATHAFRHPSEEGDLMFRGIHGLTIGWVYEGVKKGKDIRISRRPKFVRDGVAREQWVALDEVAAHFLARERARVHAKEKLKNWKEFPKLAEVCKGMTYTEIKAVVEVIVDKLIKSERRTL